METMENAQKLQPAHQSQQSQQLPQIDSQSLYKNQLQKYAQRAGLDLPIYHTKNMGQPHAPLFKCSVMVDDETYESLNTFSQKKAAEQDAAKHAFKCIFENRQEKGSSIISKNTTMCKAILNEFAAKLQVERPKYNTVQTHQAPMPVFVSTLEFRGVSYTGGSARNKREAEQLVAHDVLISILGNQEEDSTLLEILLSKAKLFSATELSMDPSCAPRLQEGSSSAGGDATKAPTQQDPTHDVLTLIINEEQFKQASKSPDLQIQGQNPATPPMQMPANECCKVASPSPADDASVSIVPSSSQNPITPLLQVLANEDYNATLALQIQGQNPATPPMQTLANECCKVASPSPADDASVSIVPSSQNPTTPPLQALANEDYNATPTPQAHGPDSLVPPSSQNPVTTPMHNFANQICEIGYVQDDRSGFPGLPQNLTAPSQSSVHQESDVSSPPPPPQIVPTAVAPIQDCSVSCASQSQSTERLNSDQRKRAKKKARMDNE